MEEKKVLLSVKDLHVKFRVRGRILTAIRGISLDFYEGESIAIVGESGSGKSVFTKTFAGMLDGNGFIDEGSIIFNDEELADTCTKLDATAKSTITSTIKKLNEYARLENGAETYRTDYHGTVVATILADESKPLQITTQKTVEEPQPSAPATTLAKLPALVMKNGKIAA